MRPWAKVNQATAAVNNRRLVIHLLREQGPLSRRQLAQRSALQSSTLTYITRDLLAKQIIRECGKRDRPGVGKKQSLLELNPDLGWVLGVGIDNNAITMAFLNAQGELIDRDRATFREPVTLLADLLRARVSNWLSRHGKPAGQLLGIGVGVPGIVDSHQGIVLHARRFKLKNFPLAQTIQDAFDLPVSIDNDSNMATIAEARLGNARAMRDFVYFLINANENTSEGGQGYSVSSLGSSLYLGGALHRGNCFGSGEINPQIEGGAYGSIDSATMLAVSDPHAPMTQQLVNLADHIVNTLVAICDLIDPAATVLGGNLAISNQAMIQYIQAQLNEKVAKVPGRAIRVEPSCHMDHGVSIGAAIVALDHALLDGDLPDSSELPEMRQSPADRVAQAPADDAISAASPS